MIIDVQTRALCCDCAFQNKQTPANVANFGVADSCGGQKRAKTRATVVARAIEKPFATLGVLADSQFSARRRRAVLAVRRASSLTRAQSAAALGARTRDRSTSRFSRRQAKKCNGRKRRQRSSPTLLSYAIAFAPYKRRANDCEIRATKVETSSSLQNNTDDAVNICGPSGKTPPAARSVERHPRCRPTRRPLEPTTPQSLSSQPPTSTLATVRFAEIDFCSDDEDEGALDSAKRRRRAAAAGLQHAAFHSLLRRLS